MSVISSATACSRVSPVLWRICSMRCSAKLVAMKLGVTTFTRMPWGANSVASTLL